MYKGIVFGLLLSPLAPAAPWGQDSLTLAVQFDRAPDHLAVQWIERESAALFSDADVTLSWLPAGSIQVRFRGTCACEPRLSSPVDPGPLAWTKVKGGRILPMIEVDCDRVAGVVRQNRGSLSAPLVARAFGRALGRVVAHEMYHYLTQSFEHTGTELFSRVMLTGALMNEDVRFAAHEVAAVRRAAASISRAAADPYRAT